MALSICSRASEGDGNRVCSSHGILVFLLLADGRSLETSIAMHVSTRQAVELEHAAYVKGQHTLTQP